MRLKDARMARIPGHRRPYDQPTERLAILELRAARGWSLEQTAERMLVTPATVAYLVRRLKVLCRPDGPITGSRAALSTLI